MFKLKPLRKSQWEILYATFLNKLDFLGNKHTFRILKRANFSTNLGLVQSAVILMICITFFLFELVDLSNRTNPSTSMAEKRAIDTQEFPLRSDFTLAISFSRSNLSQIAGLDKFYTVMVKNCLRQRTFENGENQVTVNLNCTILPTEPCSSKHMISSAQKETFSRLKLGPYFASSLQLLPKTRLLSKVPLLLSFTNIQKQKFWSVKILRLSLVPPKKRLIGNCPWDNLIQLDSQQSSTFEQVIKQHFTLFSISQFKSILTEMRINQTVTDEGLIFSQYKADQALTISKETQNTQDRKDNLLIYHGIYLENRLTHYIRNYPKIQDILGAVGGLWQVLYIVFSILLSPFSNFLMNLEIMKKLYTFDLKGVEHSAQSHAKNLLTPQEESNRVSLNNYDPVRKESCISSNRVDVTTCRRLTKIETIKLQSLRCQLNLEQEQFEWRQKLSILFGRHRKGKKIVQYATEKFMSKLDLAIWYRNFTKQKSQKQSFFRKINLACLIQVQSLIPLDIFSNQTCDEELLNLARISKFQLILDEEKSFKHRMQDAQLAYNNIISKTVASEQDKSIIDILAPEILKYFEARSKYMNREDKFEVPTPKMQVDHSFKAVDEISDQKPIESPKKKLKT